MPDPNFQPKEKEELFEAQFQTELERLRTENEMLRQQSAPRAQQISFKIGEKGGLSVYGLGRFPVTLYKEQWEKLLGVTDRLQAFLAENDHLLKKKGE